MIDLSSKTFSTILADMLARVSTELNKREGSLIRTSLAAAAWAIEGIYLQLAYIQKQAYWQTATGEYLDYIAEGRGISRKQASYAVKLAGFNVIPPIGSRFGTKDLSPQLVYSVTSYGDTSGSTKYCLLTCETAGSAGNEYTGNLISLDGVNGLTSAIMYGVQTEGADTETDDSLRERYTDTLGIVPFGGNVAAYRREILAISGVGAVQVWPTWAGEGTVKCFITDDKGNPASAALVTTVQRTICPGLSSNGYGVAPIGAKVTIASPSICDVLIQLTVVLKSTATRSVVDTQINDAIAAYFSELKEQWGVNQGTYDTNYSITVYRARIIATVMAVDGVLNVSRAWIDESDLDFVVEQSATSSYIPAIDSVEITYVSQGGAG